jgi:hypothetical protein
MDMFKAGYCVFFIAAILGGPAFGGQETSDLPNDEILAGFDKVKLKSEREVRGVVENAAAAKMSVSFVHFSWSIQSEIGKRHFAQFAVDYHRQTPKDAALFHFIDATCLGSNYSVFSDLPGWRETIYGMGEIIWMKSGRVIHVEEFGKFSSSKQFIEKCDALFR